MTQLTISPIIFMILWVVITSGCIAIGWFLRGWYDTPSKVPPPPPEEDFSGRKGKW